MNAKQASELVGDDRVMMNGRVGGVLRVKHNAVCICWDGRELPEMFHVAGMADILLLKRIRRRQ
jgi:hypothetical protein